jgi:glycosyltransferase involved in cell wall biosynthesis
MELIVHAPVWGQSGYENLSRNLLIALDKMGVNIQLHPANEWNNEVLGLTPNILSRLKRMMNTRVNPISPTVVYQVPKGQPIHTDAPTICYTLFETDRCPAPWMDSLLKMDKIFVFSEFNRRSWIQSGIPEHKISALPPAVDSFLYNPEGPRYNFSNAKGFKFLCSGDFTERKNFEAVIEAFVREFKGSENVTLIFKCHYGGFTKRYRRECMNKLREVAIRFNADNPPRILFWGDKISDFSMAALYRSVDCFVLASRGEGLGMQYLEAMASGIPVIACDWGAQADYLDEFNSFPVKSFLRIIDDPNYILKCPQALNSKWCQVDVEDLRSKMRFVSGGYEGRVGEEKTRASKALRQVRKFTWHAMAIKFIKDVINMYNYKSPTLVAA